MPPARTAYRLVRSPVAPALAPDLDDSQRAVVTHPGGPLLVLAGPGTGKTTTLVEAVVDRVERGLDGAGLRKLGEAVDRPAWVAAATFLDEYLDVLDARGEVDYAGLVAAATDLLARTDVATTTRERYRAVFVDEYQDTDPSQERLLQVLAGGGRDLVVVGDPDQSIYAFRGADVTNILQFPDRFRTAAGAAAPVLTLGVSRRAGAALLAASRTVAERIPTPGLPADDRKAHRA